MFSANGGIKKFHLLKEAIKNAMSRSVYQFKILNITKFLSLELLAKFEECRRNESYDGNFHRKFHGLSKILDCIAIVRFNY